MVVGQTLATGISLEGAEAGIVDYSRKEVDQWGNYSLVARAFVKKMTVQAVVDTVDVDRTQRLLEDYRATPTVWIAHGDFVSLGLFGFFRNFTTAFSYPTETVISFDLEGLTSSPCCRDWRAEARSPQRPGAFEGRPEFPTRGSP
jgi:hypothetical protein